jgi:hypothetical protein
VVTWKDVAAYVAVFLALPLPLVLIGVGPVLYNRYFSIVGRSYSKVLRMTTCESAEVLVRQVGERYRSRRGFVFQVTRPPTQDIFGQGVAGDAYLSLYDLTPFDDVQLGVSCDTEGRIARVDFIGD